MTPEVEAALAFNKRVQAQEIGNILLAESFHLNVLARALRESESSLAAAKATIEGMREQNDELKARLRQHEGPI